MSSYSKDTCRMSECFMYECNKFISRDVPLKAIGLSAFYFQQLPTRFVTSGSYTCAYVCLYIYIICKYLPYINFPSDFHSSS